MIPKIISKVKITINFQNKYSNFNIHCKMKVKKKRNLKKYFMIKTITLFYQILLMSKSFLNIIPNIFGTLVQKIK